MGKKIPEIFFGAHAKIIAITASLLTPIFSYSQSISDYSALPPLSVQTQSNQSIMLAMSLDHQVFMKAYNDFSDLTGDGVPDTTYIPTYHYVGYFDSTLCYAYSQPTGQDSRFVPVGRLNNIESDEEIPKCESGLWSGNFLNWATMTRIDLVRQVLYGGYRYIDDVGLTVLERSYLPHDVHSFAKYVPAGIDLDGLADISSLPYGECPPDSIDKRCEGFTFCNTTKPPAADVISQNVSMPPLLRVVRGNYMLWDASERYQCLTTSEYYPDRALFSHDEDGSNAQLKQKNYEIGRASEAKPILGQLSNNKQMRTDPSGANLNKPEKSGIQAFSVSPLKSHVSDFVVRVSVCDPNYLPVEIGEIEGKKLYSHDCERYGENYKPIGLLQRYGADPQYNVQFGLITRNYDANKSYGALRKNIGTFADEIKDDGTGRFKTLLELPHSIVHNLNSIRILDYLYQYEPDSAWTGGGERQRNEYSGTYRPDAVGHDVGCEWGDVSFREGTCRNWGNPFSQILAESYRYLTGARTANASSERFIRAGISIAEWSPVQPVANNDDDTFSCSAKGVLGFNASSVSYDGTSSFRNSTPYSLGIPNTLSTAPTLTALTNSLGQEAGLNGGMYFIGTTSDNNDGLCSVKQVNYLGEVSGTCPETPRLEGGYLGSGLAKYVYDEHDIRTFGVSLTDALARIRIPLDETDPINGPAVQIVPACRNVGNPNGNRPLGNYGNCALVSFKVIDDRIVDDQEESGVIRKGAYYVGWEDTEQGGDYDVDAAGVIRYELKSDKSLVVETELLYNGTPDILQFGYVISGTSNDGAIFPAETPGNNPNVSAMSHLDIPSWRPTRSWCTSLNRCSVLSDGYVQRVTFPSTAGSDAKFLPSPLKLAATYASGIGDDGHAEVDDPSKLRSRLDTILRGLFNALKPGTGASIATNAITGEGLVMSSLYSPELVNERKEKINWIGHFNGLFYKDGLFWENCHQPNENEPRVITKDDCVVEIFLDEDSQKTMFKRYSTVVDEKTGIVSINPNSVQGPFDYRELKPLWSANAELSRVDEPLVQRVYDEVASGKRYIFTAAAKGANINVRSNDVMPFEVENFAEDTPDAVGLGAQNYRLLGVNSATAAQDVVRFIRGDETVPNSRKRTLDGTTWLLGDIVHSSAALVGRPSANYDVDRIGDPTYAEFVRKYRNRRLVAYVGANDGMLHAFNGGFFNYNPDAPGYIKKPAGVNVKEHELGAELWAYVPYNLLPHLKWLRDPQYSHVYYVDSKVHTFDVNIFSGDEYSEEDYPGGWGTIIVVGMRFGGGPYPLDMDGDGNMDRTTRSAYIVMDVTNPEKPPRLLAELTDETLGYTTGDLDIISIRQPDATGSFANPTKNEWYLVFGSGPTGEGALKRAKSDQAARLFYVNLKRLTTTTNSNDWLKSVSTGINNSYIGGITAVDWNSDFQTDMLYFGVVGTGSGSRGALMHASVSYENNLLQISSPDRLLTNVHLPFSRAPLVVRDRTNDGYWVYAATGEFLVSDHLLEENIDDNWMFGVRVNDGNGWLQSGGISPSDLKDISDVVVKTEVQNSLRSFTVIDDSLTDVTTPEQMELKIRDNFSGWKKELRNRAELVLNSPAFSGTTLAVSSFSPWVDDECKPSGVSRLYWLNMFTGLPQTENRTIFLKDNSGVNPAGVDSDKGGFLSDHTGERRGITTGASTAGTAIVYGDNDGGMRSEDAGGVPSQPVRRAWREIPMSELH